MVGKSDQCNMIGRTGKQRKRLRLKEYDYSQPGAYFVTICTKDREHRFGEIVDGEMRANGLAAVVRSSWNDLPNHYPSVELGEFVIMPNHVHGIIIILENDTMVGDGLKPSPTRKFPLSEIVRAFKTFSARRINEISNTPGTPFWQRAYYEHIIRDDRSLGRIREYIADNPQRWESDKENSDRRANDDFDRWLSTAGKRPIRKGS